MSQKYEDKTAAQTDEWKYLTICGTSMLDMQPGARIIIKS